MSTKTEATIEDLYKVDGKAELVNGEIVHMSPTGGKPSLVARAILLSLYEYEKRTGEAMPPLTTRHSRSICLTESHSAPTLRST